MAALASQALGELGRLAGDLARPRPGRWSLEMCACCQPSSHLISILTSNFKHGQSFPSGFFILIVSAGRLRGLKQLEKAGKSSKTADLWVTWRDMQPRHILNSSVTSLRLARQGWNWRTGHACRSDILIICDSPWCILEQNWLCCWCVVSETWPHHHASCRSLFSTQHSSVDNADIIVSVYVLWCQCHQSRGSEGVRSKCLTSLLLCYFSQLYIFCAIRFNSATLNTRSFSITELLDPFPCLCVSPLSFLSHSYEVLVIPEADKMRGDSSLCCCQGKCQHVRNHFTSQMKRDPFLLLPHASQASCLRPCLCCLNGPHEWPVLVLRVWATMVVWDICMLLSTVYNLCFASVAVAVCVFFDKEEIPWNQSGVKFAQR